MNSPCRYQIPHISTSWALNGSTATDCACVTSVVSVAWCIWQYDDTSMCPLHPLGTSAYVMVCHEVTINLSWYFVFFLAPSWYLHDISMVPPWRHHCTFLSWYHLGFMCHVYRGYHKSTTMIPFMDGCEVQWYSWFWYFFASLAFSN